LQLYIVGGFLGSGKTTAIIGAARHLMLQGKRVGVVTNDQGRYLVDTAFFHSLDVPTVEVTGGCFCCNYQDLEGQLARLRDAVQPDVIFAESVGSCADIVATVVKPLLTLRAPGLMAPSSFTVFADARLLRRRLLEMPMPFSEDVVYLFDKQIEEAGMLVINKRDLLMEDHLQQVVALVQARYPDKGVRVQNSLDLNDVREWLEALESGQAAPPTESLDIDYARYGAGEAALAWLDETLVFTVPEGQGDVVVLRFIAALLSRLRESGMAIGHLKLLVKGGEGEEAKLSFPTLETENWDADMPELTGTTVEVLLNARVEASAAALHQRVHEVVAAITAELKVDYRALDVAFFHPGMPNPMHRLA
jgi:Ni2+-binding GTPase involved in maturation of urease and hydrogenase